MNDAIDVRRLARKMIEEGERKSSVVREAAGSILGPGIQNRCKNAWTILIRETTCQQAVIRRKRNCLFDRVQLPSCSTISRKRNGFGRLKDSARRAWPARVGCGTR